jgi:hypothetical protein
MSQLLHAQLAWLGNRPLGCRCGLPGFLEL